MNKVIIAFTLLMSALFSWSIPEQNLFNKRKLIEVANPFIAVAHTNYALFVRLTTNNFDYSMSRSDGRDIRFFQADDETPLSFWIEKWVVNGDSAIWVKIPVLAAYPTTNKLFLYYNNPAASSNVQSETTVFSTDDYYEIWHGDTNAAGKFRNGVTTNVGTLSEVTIEKGLMGDAPRFNGTTSRITSSKFTASAAGSGTFTISFWVNVTNFNQFDTFFAKDTYASSGQGLFFRSQNATTFAPRFHMVNNSGVQDIDYTGANLSSMASKWFYLTLRKREDRWMHCYLNGVQFTGSPSGPIYLTNGINNTKVFYIGNDSGHLRAINGLIDEFRISKTAYHTNRIRVDWYQGVSNVHLLSFKPVEISPFITLRGTVSDYSSIPVAFRSGLQIRSIIGGVTNLLTPDASGIYAISGLVTEGTLLRFLPVSSSNLSFFPASYSYTLTNGAAQNTNLNFNINRLSVKTLVNGYNDLSPLVWADMKFVVHSGALSNTIPHLSDGSFSNLFFNTFSHTVIVQPTSSYVSFQPQSYTFVNSQIGLFSTNFTFAIQIDGVTGAVSGLPSGEDVFVTIEPATGSGGTSFKTVGGNFEAVLGEGKYRVAPFKSGYLFEPAFREVTVVKGGGFVAVPPFSAEKGGAFGVPRENIIQPVNGHYKIPVRFGSSIPTYFKATLVSASGKTYSILFDGKPTETALILEIEASGLPSGIYFIQEEILRGPLQVKKTLPITLIK